MDARPHPPSPTTPESSGESRLYVDMMSQPSRACAYFVQLCGLPVEIRAVNLGKREHKAPGYLAMNPLGQVPCLREADGFALPESSAILKYLADRHRRRVADHWYPVDLRSRARVNAALDWYHGTIRKGAAGVTWHALVAKNMGGALSRETARSMFGVLTAALETLETTWLSASPGGGPFMMGRQQPCVADLLVAEELFNLVLLEAVDDSFALPESLEQLLGDAHPNVVRLLDAVKDLDPVTWTSLHAVLDRVKGRLVERKSRPGKGEGATAKL